MKRSLFMVALVSSALVLALPGTANADRDDWGAAALGFALGALVAPPPIYGAPPPAVYPAPPPRAYYEAPPPQVFVPAPRTYYFEYYARPRPRYFHRREHWRERRWRHHHWRHHDRGEHGWRHHRWRDRDDD